MRRHRRLILLLGLFVLLAGLVIFDPPGQRSASPAIAAALPPRAPAERTVVERPGEPHGEASTTLMALRPRRPLETPPENAFASRDWTPPPPPPPPAPPPPPPQAPPLPFLFLGKQLVGEQWQVFLGRQDRTYIVHAGDVIEDTYLVDKIAPPLLALTYLPLKQSQTLTIGTPQ